MKHCSIFLDCSIFVLLLCALAACSNGNKDSKTPEDPKSIAAKEVPVNTVEQHQQQLERTMIFLDGSVSMQGYITPSVTTNFPTTITALEGISSGSCKEFLFKNKIEPILGPPLSQKITERKLKLDGQESNLGYMLQQMVDSAKISSNSLFILVTDGILSASNETIRKEREWNRVHRETLEAEIENIFRPAKGQIASIVLQYIAPFKGTYTAYDNQTKTFLDNRVRPYYIIAIGGKTVIKQFYSEIKEGHRIGLKDFKNIAYYGLDYELEKPVIEQTDKVHVEKAGYRVLSTAENILLTYNVSKLPNQMLAEMDSLISHIRIFTSSGEESKMLDDKYYSVKLAGSSLRITIKDKYELFIPGDLEIRIASWQYGWIDASTSFDDKKPDSDRTFNLVHLLRPFNLLNDGERHNHSDWLGYLDNSNSIHLIN